MLTRPACGRPNARTRRLNHPRHVVSLHVPSRRRRACGDHATSRLGDGRARNRTPNGCGPHDAPTRQHGNESSSPGSSPRRDRHRARGRRPAAAGRAGLSFPLRVSLPALGRSTTRSTVVVRDEVRPRAALLAHKLARRRLRRPRRPRLCAKNHICRRPPGGRTMTPRCRRAERAMAGVLPRGAVEDPLRRGCLFRRGAASATCTGWPRLSVSPRCPEKPFLNPQEFKRCGGAA